MAGILRLEIDDNELRLLVAAVRQVKHTFSIAEAQGRAAGEPLDPQYQPLQDMYDRLEQRLLAVAKANNIPTHRPNPQS